MANVNANKPPPPPSWRDRSPLNLTPLLHAIPQNFDKSFPKFETNEGIFVDDHLRIFYLPLEGLQATEHEYVVYRLFPHTLKGKAAHGIFPYRKSQSQTGTPLRDCLETWNPENYHCFNERISFPQKGKEREGA